MEYPKNNMYRPAGTFGYRGAGAMPFAAETAKAQERKSSCLEGVSLAMVYAPVQRFQGLYEPEEALSRGTIFQELEKPFLGGRGR